jgi:hypothetical protein
MQQTATEWFQCNFVLLLTMCTTTCESYRQHCVAKIVTYCLYFQFVASDQPCLWNTFCICFNILGTHLAKLAQPWLNAHFSNHFITFLLAANSKVSWTTVLNLSQYTTIHGRDQVHSHGSVYIQGLVAPFSEAHSQYANNTSSTYCNSNHRFYAILHTLLHTIFIFFKILFHYA